MISSLSNPKVKQIVQWQGSAARRREAEIFLTEGFKMFEEAPEEAVREVYVTAEALEKIGQCPLLREKLERIGRETVTEEVFRKMSDTQTPQGILCVVERPAFRLERLPCLWCWRTCRIPAIWEPLSGPGRARASRASL